MERKKAFNTDDGLKQKMKNWKSKEECGLSQETIQLMTGKFQLESVRNVQNFLETLNLHPVKRMIFGTVELNPTAVTMTIEVEKDEDGEFQWTVVAEHPMIPEKYRIQSNFCLNIIDEEVFLFETLYVSNRYK